MKQKIWGFFFTCTVPGTKGVPLIQILVISRGYHQLPRYCENCAQTLFEQSQPRIKTEESGPKRQN